MNGLDLELVRFGRTDLEASDVEELSLVALVTLIGAIAVVGETRVEGACASITIGVVPALEFVGALTD